MALYYSEITVKIVHTGRFLSLSFDLNMSRYRFNEPTLFASMEEINAELLRGTNDFTP